MRYKKPSVPSMVSKTPGTLKIVFITVICVLAFFYVVGIISGSPAPVAESVAAVAEKDAEESPPQDPDSSADSAPPVSEPIITTANVYYGDLELPVDGATGYAAVKMSITATAGLPIEIVGELDAGAAFLIVREEGDRWEIISNGIKGWVRHSACMINLPDVIPSIVYDCTNTYKSLFTSSGKEIPGITGLALYEGKMFNPRLGESEYIVPVMYSMSKRISRAQRSALANNETLVIYEAFRPYEVQRRVAEGLDALSDGDRDVRRGIYTGSWKLNSFMPASVSSHQLGGGIDVSLAKIDKESLSIAGTYQYMRVEDCTVFEMPSQMHELSAVSVTYTYAVDSTSKTAWEKAVLSPAMAQNPAAQRLQSYFTEVGLTPLSSEWWHFNDLATLADSPDGSDGEFILKDCLSVYPTDASPLDVSPLE